MIPNWHISSVIYVFDSLKKTSILTDESVPENINNQLSTVIRTRHMYDIEIGQNKKEQDFVVKLSNICKSLETIKYTRARLTSLKPPQRVLEILSEESNVSKIEPYLPAVYKFLKKSDEGVEKANKLLQKTLNILVTNEIVNEEFVQLELTKYTPDQVKAFGLKDLEVPLFKNLTICNYDYNLSGRLVILPEKTSVMGAFVSQFSLLRAYVTGVFDFPLFREDFLFRMLLDQETLVLTLFFTELESVLCQRDKFSLKEYFTSDASVFDKEEVDRAIEVARDILKKEMMKITKNIKKQALEGKSIDKIWESIGKSKYGEVLLTANPQEREEVELQEFNEVFERIQKAIGRNLDSNRFVSYGSAREGGSRTAENELSNSICSVSEINSDARAEIKSLYVLNNAKFNFKVIHMLSEMAGSMEYDEKFFNIIDQRVKTVKIKAYESHIKVLFYDYFTETNINNDNSFSYSADRAAREGYTDSKALDKSCELCFLLHLNKILKDSNIGVLLEPNQYCLQQDIPIKLSPDYIKYLIIDVQIDSPISLNERLAHVFNKTKFLKSIRSLKRVIV